MRRPRGRSGTIRPLEPFDPHTESEARWARYLEFADLRHDDAGYPGDPPTAAVRMDFMRGPMSAEWAMFCAEDGERIVGAVWFHHDRNERRLVVSGGTLGEVHGRGIRTAWLRHALDLVERAGVEEISVRTSDRRDDPRLEGLGLRPGERIRSNELDLAAVDQSLLERWVGGLAETAPGVRLVLHEDRVPDEIWPDYVTLRNASGDFGEPIDVATEKGRVAALTGPDGLHHAVLTYESDGTVSGLSDVTWRPDQPDVAHQRFTGVLPALRGGGRGKALKAAMLRFLRERHEAPLRITTSNEVSRGPMIAINERLGFESRLAVVDWRIGRAALAAALSRSP